MRSHQTITNPVLPGFNPDPSIVRAGDDYYIATSTFEWFPGVAVYHSRDLVHWNLRTYPLTRTSQLDLRGVPASGGVWAPCLTWDNGTFYLIYTVVHTLYGQKDLHNYLVTAQHIDGPWSEPVFLNSTGFDPSLFHGEDGRKWLINMVWDHRKGRNKFSGIVLQELDVAAGKLTGPVRKIYQTVGTELAEGAHLYHVHGWYYLMIAEGGTGVKHSVLMARSRSLEGPYETDPLGRMMTSQFNPRVELQKAGHGCLVQTGDGRWYMTHIAARPIPSWGRCTLGRETCIQEVVWDSEGWLRLAHGGIEAAAEVPAPDLPEHRAEPLPEVDDFDSTALNIHFQAPRVPLDQHMLSLHDRPGYLRLFGRESLLSKFVQSTVVRRWQHFCFEASCRVEITPGDYKHGAGLLLVYDFENYAWLRVTADDHGRKVLGIETCTNGLCDEPCENMDIDNWEKVYLKVEVSWDRMQFSASPDGTDWKRVGPEMDASRLSDEFCREGWFTGAMVGLHCQDLSGQRRYADFDWFCYRGEKGPEA